MSHPPAHLKVKLNNMPPNKGYVFRGNWFFGTMGIDKMDPAQLIYQDHFVFELLNKNIMLIHKYNIKTYTIIEKNLQTKREIVLSETPRCAYLLNALKILF